MNRFLIASGADRGAVVPLPADEAAHATRVLRLKSGAPVELFDGQGHKWSGILIDAEKDRATVELLDILPAHEPAVEITLFQGVLKFEKLDLIVQKATELGARRIVPVTMERSVARLDRKDGEKRRERLARIALEAAKQCGRAVVPEIGPFLGWRETLTRLDESALKLMPWEEERSVTLRSIAEKTPQVNSLALLIGPEGGIAPREADEAKRRGACAVTLGPRILRAETAAITALSLAMGLWGDLL